MLTGVQVQEEIGDIRTNPNKWSDDQKIVFLESIITGGVAFASRPDADHVLYALVGLAANGQNSRVSGYLQEALEKLKIEEDDDTVEGRFKDAGDNSPAARADDNSVTTDAFDAAAQDTDVPKNRSLPAMLLGIAQTDPSPAMREAAVNIYAAVAEAKPLGVSPAGAGTLQMLANMDPSPKVQQAAKNVLTNPQAMHIGHPKPQNGNKKDRKCTEGGG